MKIFFHVKRGTAHWEPNEIREAVTVPRVGEFVAFDSPGEEWLRVQLVVHIPFKADCDVEVYGIPVTHLEALKTVG